MSSNLEALKLESRHLRGTLAEELASPEPGFSEASQHLLKPHGFYQQKDRDRRKDPVPSPPAVPCSLKPASALAKPMPSSP